MGNSEEVKQIHCDYRTSIHKRFFMHSFILLKEAAAA